MNFEDLSINDRILIGSDIRSYLKFMSDEEKEAYSKAVFGRLGKKTVKENAYLLKHLDGSKSYDEIAQEDKVLFEEIAKSRKYKSGKDFFEKLPDYFQKYSAIQSDISRAFNGIVSSGGVIKKETVESWYKELETPSFLECINGLIPGENMRNVINSILIDLSEEYEKTTGKKVELPSDVKKIAEYKEIVAISDGISERRKSISAINELFNQSFGASFDPEKEGVAVENQKGDTEELFDLGFDFDPDDLEAIFGDEEPDNTGEQVVDEEPYNTGEPIDDILSDKDLDAFFSAEMAKMEDPYIEDLTAENPIKQASQIEVAEEKDATSLGTEQEYQTPYFEVEEEKGAENISRNPFVRLARGIKNIFTKNPIKNLKENKKPKMLGEGALIRRPFDGKNNEPKLFDDAKNGLISPWVALRSKVISSMDKLFKVNNQPKEGAKIENPVKNTAENDTKFGYTGGYINYDPTKQPVIPKAVGSRDHTKPPVGPTL